MKEFKIMKHALNLLLFFFSGEQYNLTGSSKFALLGETFTWTCRMFVPTNQTAKAVLFYRNNKLVVAIGHINNECITQSANIKYTYACLSDYVYTLTIPAENMTEMEQGSMWRCGYVGNLSYRRVDVMLKIASKTTCTNVHYCRVKYIMSFGFTVDYSKLYLNSEFELIYS